MEGGGMIGRWGWGQTWNEVLKFPKRDLPLCVPNNLETYERLLFPECLKRWIFFLKNHSWILWRLISIVLPRDIPFPALWFFSRSLYSFPPNIYFLFGEFAMQHRLFLERWKDFFLFLPVPMCARTHTHRRTTLNLSFWKLFLFFWGGGSYLLEFFFSMMLLLHFASLPVLLNFPFPFVIP